ncbi:uncharacterized protein LOC127865691 isoform X1 [Dreissena polymorpha]|uniref:uncharacterized protein LOC127865691 isoform X1 n=2 Tax=Dreissena polymorpha TaxID=45954 RepID=UPI002265641B|nr:uncharacterized protein LOC127865691 isoform X1 [Dreissena polymorpha]
MTTCLICVLARQMLSFQHIAERLVNLFSGLTHGTILTCALQNILLLMMVYMSILPGACHDILCLCAVLCFLLNAGFHWQRIKLSLFKILLSHFKLFSPLFDIVVQYFQTTFCELYRECWEQQRGSLFKGVHQSLLSLFSVGRVFHLYSQWSSIQNRGAMGKADPRTAKGGKRKASRAASPEEPAPKQNRLATLIAEAISQDREVLEEIQTLLTAPTEPTRKPDGTSSAISISETDNISEESDDVSSVLAMSNFGDGPSTSSAADISLGVFSVVHPPLDQNTMNKIVNGEYVDFPSLIFKDQNHETTTIHKTQSSTITSTHKASRKQLHNIHQWNEAFQIYSDIYTQKYPTQAPHLFRYMTIIQRLSNSTRAWLTYDEKFRRLRAACPSIPWGTVHIETFLFCTTLGQSQPFRTTATPSSGFRSFSNRPNKSPFFRRGYCWDFQQVGSCERPRCTQAHRCGGCEGPHGAFQCNQPFLKPKRNNFASPFTPKPSSFGKPTTSQQQQQQQQK